MSKSYKVTIPHVSITLIYSCEAALFAAEYGGVSKHEKKQLMNIARLSFKKLYTIGEKFSLHKGAALALLADSKNIWLTAKAYQDAAIAIPEKRKEYLINAHSLISECKAFPDCERVRRLMMDSQISSDSRS